MATMSADTIMMCAARGAALELAVAITRAATATAGESAPEVLGVVAAGWLDGLPVELRSLYSMAGEMAAGRGLLKAG